MSSFLTETDQMACYSEHGRRINCKGAGQDASKPGKVIRGALSRFKIFEHIVEDMLTGAIWSRDANPAGYPLSWIEAHAFIADMRDNSIHGYGDWQLPARDLLFSLISHQMINPALPEGHPFQNVFPGYYWTAETSHRLAEQAWYIHLGGGRIHRGMKHGSYMVWPVIPGSAGRTAEIISASDRFEGRDIVYVHDTHTGLGWCQNADLIGRKLTWQEAIAAVEELNRTGWGGHNDWRMPNIRELESLIDLQRDSPALPSRHPFSDIRDVYWSSTTSIYQPRYAWAVYTQDGIVGVGFKANRDFYLWPVRTCRMNSKITCTVS